MSLNTVAVCGRMTKDAELKYTNNGTAVANFSVAVNRNSKNDAGEYEVDFFNVVAWKHTAEFVTNYLGKGREVTIQGRLQQRNWVDQSSGQKRSVIEIVANDVNSVGPRPDNGEGGDQQGYADDGQDYEQEAAPPPPRQQQRPAQSNQRPAQQSRPPQGRQAPPPPAQNRQNGNGNGQYQNNRQAAPAQRPPAQRQPARQAAADPYDDQGGGDPFAGE